MENRQFQQQFELVKSLGHLDGVVKVLALEKYQNSLLLVFEVCTSCRRWRAAALVESWRCRFAGHWRCVHSRLAEAERAFTVSS